MPLHALLLASLAALSLSITHQDWRTTCVSVWKLALFAAVGLAWALLTPWPDTPRLEHLIGGGLAGGVGAMTGAILAHRMGRIAFGGADSWILAGGGLVVGMQWIGPWLGASVALGLLGFAARAGRPDPIAPDGRPILPFAPILLGVFWVIVAGRLWLDWPARPW